METHGAAQPAYTDAAPINTNGHALQNATNGTPPECLAAAAPARAEPLNEPIVASDAPPPVWKALKMCLRDDGKLEMWTMYEKKAEWETGMYVGDLKNSHHVLEGQSDGGTAYGGKGKFPY